MSVGKSVIVTLALLLMAGLIVVGCEGDQGVQGPQGLAGTEGDPGQDWVVTPPADRSFGLMVTNGTASDYQGVALVGMAFTVDGTPGSSGVTAVALEKAPKIDGTDGGSAEWGDAAIATVGLGPIAGSDNGITEASIRAAFDRDYIYMQVSWTEVEGDGFAVAADMHKNQWTYESESGTWTQAGGEDKLFVAWEIGDIAAWDSEGLGSIFDGAAFKTSAEGQMADLWVWQSTETDYVGILGDMVVTFDGDDGLAYDMGRAPTVSNDGGDQPLYMMVNSTMSGSMYPLMSFEFADFDPSQSWLDGAVIPGYVHFSPTLSVADVQAEATFAAGVWTVELRRLRNTGNGDDAGF